MELKLETLINCIEERRYDEALMHANMALVEVRRNQDFGALRAASWLREQGMPFNEVVAMNLAEVMGQLEKDAMLGRAVMSLSSQLGVEPDLATRLADATNEIIVNAVNMKSNEVEVDFDDVTIDGKPHGSWKLTVARKTAL